LLTLLKTLISQKLSHFVFQIKIQLIVPKLIEFYHFIWPLFTVYSLRYWFSKRNATFFLVGGSSINTMFPENNLYRRKKKFVFGVSLKKMSCRKSSHFANWEKSLKSLRTEKNLKKSSINDVTKLLWYFCVEVFVAITFKNFTRSCNSVTSFIGEPF
jgi:hypothetical protein